MASAVSSPPAARQQSLSPSVNSSQEAALQASRSNGSAHAAAAAAAQQGPRRTSFNFLRRQKSGDSRPSNMPTPAAGKMSKKQRQVAQEELARQQREAAALARSPPRLPTHAPLPAINSFGAQGHDGRPDSVAIATNRPADYDQQEYHAMSSSVPIPVMPHSSPGSRNGEYDPYPRAESMTHRGRYSYASSAVSMGGTINSPRRVRRRRDPTPFNILVIGAKNAGKTSFINFLQTSLMSSKKARQPADKQQSSPPRAGTAGVTLPQDSTFTSQYLETEVDHERIGVTLWDSQGLEKNIVDLQLREMSSFLESKFEETFTEEQKVVRAPGVRDTHIHCVFLILDPIRLDANLAASRQRAANKYSGGGLRLVGGLDEDLDLQVMRTLLGKTTVIPVISKADTITTSRMAHLKRTVWTSLRQAKLDPLEALNLVDTDSEEDEFDERDEDRYNGSGDEEDAGGISRNKRRDTTKTIDVIDNLVDRSDDSDDAGEPGAHSSSPSQKHVRSSPPTSPSPHNRNVSAMSTNNNNSLGENEVPYLPMSIISPDMYDPEADGSSPPGRKFPWGFADPYNVEHCDFVRLKDSVFSDWRAELREASRETWYEGWRTSRLKRHNESNAGPGSRAGRTSSARPATVGTGAGADAGASMRSPNGRQQAMYANQGQVPGQAVTTPQSSVRGGTYRSTGQYQ